MDANNEASRWLRLGMSAYPVRTPDRDKVNQVDLVSALFDELTRMSICDCDRLIMVRE